MQVTELWQQVLFGFLGGGAAEILHWYLLARKPRGAGAYAKHLLYWVTTMAMIGLGALMPVLYLSGPASALLCFHLGAATPLLLQKLVSAAPHLAQAQGLADQTTLRNFLDW
jgi:hypothetical protein